MASGSSLSSMLLFGKRNEEDHVNQAINAQPQTTPPKRRRNPPAVTYPDVEVIALSPTTLMAKNRFVCEVCYKGFPRDQNLQLHKRGHNLPWKLKQKSTTDEVKKKVYLCPEPSCINHDPSHALGDLTGIKKHYSRKHGEKKYKCHKCTKMYAVKSDLKAHSKTCGTKEYQCHCGTVFSRRDSFISHRAFCDALAEGITPLNPVGVSSFTKNTRNHNHHSQNLTHSSTEIKPGVSQLGPKSYDNVITRSSMDLNYYKPSLDFLGSSSDQQNRQKYQEKVETSYFTNLVNNTNPPHNNMQLYNLNFMGHPINFEASVTQLSATALLQKAALLGSTSSNNSSTNFTLGYPSSSSSGGALGGIKSEGNNFTLGSGHFGLGSSIFNQYAGATNKHEDNYQHGHDSGSGGYDDEGRTINSEEELQPQNTSFNMGFRQFSGVKTTRDFLGVGGEMVGNISHDGPKSNSGGRSFL